MKYYLFVFLWIVSIDPIEAQTKRFEIGLDAVSIGQMQTLQSPYYHRGVQGISGIFARYQLSRIGFRIALHYAKFESNPKGIPCPDCITTTQKVSFSSASVGAQYNLLPTQEWLYAFGDVRYSHKVQEGRTSGSAWAAPTKFEHRTNGFNTFLGIGVRATVFKTITFSLEPALEAGNYRAKYTSLNLNTQQTSVGNQNFNAFSFASRFWVGVRF